MVILPRSTFTFDRSAAMLIILVNKIILPLLFGLALKKHVNGIEDPRRKRGIPVLCDINCFHAIIMYMIKGFFSITALVSGNHFRKSTRKHGVGFSTKVHA